MLHKFLLTVVVLSLAAIGYIWYMNHVETNQIYHKKLFRHQFVIEQAHTLMGFDLVDPQQAPLNIRSSVMRGYQIVLNTPFYAPECCKNQLSCTNCHFCAGDTLGSKNGGISLVGVTNMYPRFSKREGRSIGLSERITNCFERSMNGIAPALDSQMMKDIITYLQWISKEVEHIKDVPWLGLPTIKSKHEPDPVQGQKDYENYCQACHQKNGDGGGELGMVEGKTIPPIWGPNSFNNGAGMHTMNMLAPFILLNMPYQQALLTEEQALDIAAYIRTQPRPQFVP